MAEFCKQCSIDTFGKDFGDFKGMAPEESEGLYPIVLCEGCGPIQVDNEGSCVSNDCLEKHNVTL